MNELIGKKINKIFIDSDSQYYLKFETDQGEFVYVVSGDCCSESYFAEIFGVNNFKDRIVEEVEQMYLGEADGTRQDCDKIYGFKIKCRDLNYKYSDQYTSLIIFRNSSNGYYGGECTYLDQNTSPKYIIENIAKVNWKELTKDYREDF